MKIGVCFYYVGDLTAATDQYSRLLESKPAFADEDWVRFELSGGNLALHLDVNLPRTEAAEPVQYGAVVSLTVDDMRDFMARAHECGFRQIREVEDLPYGLQSQLRDPWGNRLSVVQPKES